MTSSWLDTYRQKQSGQGWHSVSAESAFYDQLARQLQEAGEFDDLRGLFDNPEWMNVRLAHADFQYDGYLADLDIAWKQAETAVREQLRLGVEPRSLADLVHYSLLISSIHTLATNYPPELIAHALELGLWSPERALSIAGKIPYPLEQSLLYGTLLPLLPDYYRASAIQATFEILIPLLGVNYFPTSYRLRRTFQLDIGMDYKTNSMYHALKLLSPYLNPGAAGHFL